MYVCMYVFIKDSLVLTLFLMSNINEWNLRLNKVTQTIISNEHNERTHI